MSEDDFVRIQGFIGSDGPLIGHDFRLPREALDDLADQIRGQKIPMQVDHDDRRRVTARVIASEVREVSPGQMGVWVDYEVPREFAMARRAFSIAFSRRIGSTGPDGAPPINLAADVINFGEEKTRDAADRLGAELNVEIALLYQLEVKPPAKVIIGLERAAVAQLADATTAALLDGLRVFLADEPSEFRFDLGNQHGKVTALVKTNDAGVLARAIAGLPAIGVDAQVVEFDASTGSFVPVVAS